MAKSKQAIVVYVPVIHAGYLELFSKYPQADLTILDKKLLEPEFRSLQKDIRALETTQIVESLKTLLPKSEIRHLKTTADLKSLAEYDELILAEDEVSDWLAEAYFDEQKIKRDSIFLRWNKSKTKQLNDVSPDEEVTTDELHQRFIGEMKDAASKSPDWWRHNAAMAAKGDEVIIMGINKHVPSDQQQYIFGDARANYSRGIAVELSTAYHAEEAVVAQAAAEGISLKDADFYTLMFPCPFCARLIAYSGVKRLYYKDGYSIMDGAELLKSRGVELIKVVEE